MDGPPAFNPSVTCIVSTDSDDQLAASESPRNRGNMTDLAVLLLHAIDEVVCGVVCVAGHCRLSELGVIWCD